MFDNFKPAISRQEKEKQQLSGLQRQIQINRNNLVSLVEQSMKKGISSSNIKIQERINECLISCLEVIQKFFPMKTLQMDTFQEKIKSKYVEFCESEPEESSQFFFDPRKAKKKYQTPKQITSRKKIKESSVSSDNDSINVQDLQISVKNEPGQQTLPKDDQIGKKEVKRRGRKKSQTKGSIINQFLKEQRKGYQEFFEVIYKDGKMNNPIYKCKHCPNTLYYHKQHCSVHWKTKHCPTRFQCSNCSSQYFSTVFDYFIHYYVYHNQKIDIKEENIPCNFCERVCSRKSQYGKHIISKHFEEIQQELVEFKEATELKNQTQS